MADRGQVTGDKCGIVTRAGGVGDKNCCGCRVGDIFVFHDIRTPGCRVEVRDGGLATLQFGGAIRANSAIGTALECDHGCSSTEGSMASQRWRPVGSMRMAISASLACRLETDRQRMGRLGGLKAGSERTIRCANRCHWQLGTCQAFQGLMGGLIGRARKCSVKALKVPLSGPRRCLVGLILLNAAGKVF